MLLLVAHASSAGAQCGPSGTSPYPPGSTTCPGSSGGSSGSTTSTCAEDGADYTWTDTVAGSTRTLTVSGCPNHPTGDLNPNYAVKSSATYSVPAMPEYSASQETSLAAVGGVTGVTFDGTQM